MGLKEKKISFKVHNLVNWIGIGVCMKNKIESVSYAFKCTFLLIKMNSQGMEATLYQIMATLGLIVLLTIIFAHADILLRMGRLQMSPSHQPRFSFLIENPTRPGSSKSITKKMNGLKYVSVLIYALRETQFKLSTSDQYIRLIVYHFYDFMALSNFFFINRQNERYSSLVAPMVQTSTNYHNAYDSFY